MRKSSIVQTRPADDRHRVVSVETTDAEGAGPAYRRRPCEAHDDQPACPWRLDATPGEYPPEVYRLSARTAYDQAMHTFGCHQSTPERPQDCAGFLLRNAEHNARVRLWKTSGADLSDVHSDVPLYDSYRDMAVANGVDPDDPALERCRGNLES